MNSLNKILKIITFFCAALVLFLLLVIPKTDCQTCEIRYNGRIIDGYEAFEIFEEECISYDKPWNDNRDELNIQNYTEKEYIYVDIDDINLTFENEMQLINFK